MINKVVASVEEALADIHSGAVVLVGGFAFCGVPENLLAALARRPLGDLSIISDDVGFDDWGVGRLLQAGLVRKVLVGRSPDNPTFERLLMNGSIEAVFSPLGTLVERLRAGGAGIPAFYTATGVGTVVAEGKEVREFDGRAYLLERAITGDFGMIAAWRGDRLGNLVYRGSARNTNPSVAAAARVCIAEVEELVEVGELTPEQVHTPAIHVQRVVVAARAKGLGHPLSQYHPAEG